MRSSHVWSVDAARFDDPNLVSCAGLVPVLALAELTGMEDLLERVRFQRSKVKSGAVNPAGKLGGVIAGMVAGADSIDDLDVIRSGGMPQVFEGVYASAALGILLREFTFGHTKQLASAARAHLVALAARTKILDGADQRVFLDIDSLLRPVYGHAKQGASFGHTKIAGRQVLRTGHSPLATTLSTPTVAPVVAGIRLRAGTAGSGKGAASMVTESIGTARAAVPGCEILVRGDCAYGTSHVVAAARAGGARFSVVLTKTRSVNRAIAAIPQDAWTPVHYPGAVEDPDTGALISDAEVAEIIYTAFTSTKNPVTARLIVRRVRDRNHNDALFPVWRYHPFFTDNTEPVTAADITHRGHAIIETVFSDLIDGPLAHLPWRILRRELRLGDLRGDGAQPAPRRRHPDQRPNLPRGDLAPPGHQRSRPPRPTPTPTHPAPAPPLALGHPVEHALAQHLQRPTRPACQGIDPDQSALPGPDRHRRSWTDQQLTHAPARLIDHHSPEPLRRSTQWLVHGSRLRPPTRLTTPVRLALYLDVSRRRRS